MRFGGHHIDVPGGGQLDDRVARLDRSGAVIFGGGVGTAADHRSSGRNPGPSGGLGGHFTDPVDRIDQLRQNLDGDTGQRRQLLRPGALLHVVEERSLRLDVVGHGDAGHQIADVILDEENVPGPAQHLRLMLRKPAQLRQRPGRRRMLVGGRIDAFAILRFQLGTFGGAALVGPHDGAAERLHRTVEQHRVMGAAVEGERGDPAEIHAGSADPGERGAHRLIPVAGLLFRPAGVFVPGSVLDRTFSGKMTGGVDQGDFAPPGAEIDSEQQVAGTHRVTSPRRGRGPSRRSAPG